MNITDSQNDSPLILVVDDDKFMRIQLRRAMEQSGYRVAEASNGEEALAAYTRLYPDIVLLDAMMPVMDGFTCCTRLQALARGDRNSSESYSLDASECGFANVIAPSRTNVNTSGTPVLMITALEDQESVDQAFEAGAIDYITKPIHWAVLRQRVRRLLETSRATQELHQQTERTRLSEQRLRLALEAARMGTWDWDILSDKLTYCITAAANSGMASDSSESTFDNFLASVHPEDQELVTQAVRSALEEGTDYNTEFRVLRSDGTVDWLANKGQVYYDKTGKAIRMTGINMNITERKQTEEALRQSEERFQIVALATNDAIWDWNLLTNQVWWNTGVQKLFGYSAQEVGPDATWWYESVHPDDLERTVSEIHAVINSGQQFWSHEYRFRRSDGSYAYIFDRGYVVQDQRGKAVRMIGAMMDITATKQAQEELQRQTMRSQLFAEVTLKIRRSLQLETILQTTVNEVQRIFQTDRVLIFQLWSNGFGKIVTEAVNPSWPSVLGRSITEDYFGAEYLARYSQGRIYTIADIDKAEIPGCLIEFMQEFNVKAKLAVPIFLKAKLWGLLVAHQCATPRQWSSFETELLGQLADQIGIALAQSQLLEQETRQRQELARSNAELQQFASVASHDLQEPLRKIQVFANRLKATCSEALTDQGLDYLGRMENAAERMQALIDDLLTLSRVTTKAQPFVPVNLIQVTREVLSDLEVRIQQTGGRVEVGKLPTIDADPIQMRQLLQNLISNALKFHRDEEPQVVKIYSLLLEDQQNPPRGGSPSTECCQIIVEDNGIGFDEKYLDRIFNVFQRLHSRSEFEGTGVGLAICRKIAERHGGKITAESKLGQGAKFITTLPIKRRTGEKTE